MQSNLDFRSLCERFGSLESVAEYLREYAGFAELNRSTVSRWLSKPTRRTHLASVLLSGETIHQPLTLAEPLVVSALPSRILTWTVRPGTPYGLFVAQTGTELEVHAVDNDSEALRIIEEGKATIALISGDLAKVLPNDCARLCSLTRSGFTGVSRKQINSIRDFDGLRVGAQPDSSLAVRFGDLAKKWKIGVKSIVSFDHEADYIRPMLHGQLDCVIGLEPFVSHFGSAIKLSMRTFPIRSEFVGDTSLEVVFNKKVGDPSQIRAYLLAVSESASYIENHKANGAFQAEVAQAYSMPLGDLKEVLRASSFLPNDFNGPEILRLWHIESSRNRRGCPLVRRK